MLFERTQDSNLVGFAVWVPELGAHIGDVPTGTTLVSDPRIKHYWDADERLGKFYETSLPTPGTPSWDVYLLYRPGIMWTDAAPPKPTFWMHQLGGVTAAPRLDPEVFAQQAHHMLKS